MNHDSALLIVTLISLCCILNNSIDANFITNVLLMDPSEEKRENKKQAPKKRSFVLLAVLLLCLFASIGGIYAFLQSSSPPPLAVPEPLIEEEPAVGKSFSEDVKQEEEVSPEIVGEDPVAPPPMKTDSFDIILSDEPGVKEEGTEPASEQLVDLSDSSAVQEMAAEESIASTPPKKIVTVCTEPSKRLDAFYSHLDQQPYIQAYKLQESSDVHFEKLIEKLLANPPKVTRESDDLYTILRNTAHFFRISGKDNILMLKGILNSEKDSLEQILADYYFLITTPACIHDKYAKDINGDALYEYACFFLNTMGGRLYLFRRDSESRMVVTYYAILLVDLANRQQNNRHGIALKPAINMLISEMETGGSNMKGSEDYLDILYDLKEAYQ